MNAHSALMRLGFSEYEARAYTALVQRSPLNGYEIAKESGVPRANIYAVLDKLMARNAIKRFESAGGTRYTAVDPTKLTRNLAREHDRTLREAERSLESISAPPAFDYVWNAEGYDAFLAAVLRLDRSTAQAMVVEHPEFLIDHRAMFEAAEQNGSWNLAGVAIVCGLWLVLGLIACRLTFRWIRKDS